MYTCTPIATKLHRRQAEIMHCVNKVLSGLVGYHHNGNIEKYLPNRVVKRERSDG
jgi:hypothetical protein